MIREDPDATVRDYLDLLRDLEKIEQQVNEEDMGSRKGIPNLTPEQKKQIIALVKQKHSIGDICRKMNISPNAVYTSCRWQHKNIRSIKGTATDTPIDLTIEKAPIEKSRPAAVYSNSSPWGIASAYNNQTTTP